MSVLRLFTIQHAGHWRRGRASGLLVPRATRNPFFAKAYAWMRAQVRARVPNASGRYPVWAWPERPKRLQGYRGPGTQLVLLEVEVPAERVVLSSYDAWHLVLGDSYLTLSEEEADAVEASPPSREEIERSWERVFDLEHLTEWAAGTDRKVQACVDGLFAHEVRSETWYVEPERTPDGLEDEAEEPVAGEG